MEDSFDSSSLSPSKLLARLQELRALQDVARQKLQRQRALSRPRSAESSPVLCELLGADSTSYRNFQRLLLDSNDSPQSGEGSRIRSDDLIDGVSVLNLSQESEFVISSPSSGRSRVSSKSGSVHLQKPKDANLKPKTPPIKGILKKNIELEEMPILSPRSDFETLLMEKMENEKVSEVQAATKDKAKVVKKPFLRRGEGLTRFGLKKDALVIQNTKSLPWKRKSQNNSQQTNSTTQSEHSGPNPVQIEEDSPKPINVLKKVGIKKHIVFDKTQPQQQIPPIKMNSESTENRVPKTTVNKQNTIPQTKSNKTWAAILTQEQDRFLQQLKQSSYYKNFESPTRSMASDASCNESLLLLRQDRETAEQNMFELLESKVSSASFCSESSFIHKFFRNKADCSGDSTPMILQRCLANNPQLFQLFPAPESKPVDRRGEQCEQQTVFESSDTEYIDCDHESSSSTSSSCSTCRSVEETNNSVGKEQPESDDKLPDKQKNKSEKEQDNSTLDKTVTETDDTLKTNMAEMNAKLMATSELLKERLHELEDEIEMFRRENASLAKMREEIDVERQRFFDERAAYEQKFNEDKILSEYYLAEEKEKLAKQKQVYDRYVREMRGRLSRKEKDEVTKLKKEIEDLKEDHRTKEAKLTSSIARLRNQLKVSEKEKNDLQDQCEKQKKENRRIQQVNTTTRRLSNIKYLSEINKKLAIMGSNDKTMSISADEIAKYKSEEIASRGRTTKTLPVVNCPLRARAKSVPNLTVTSRYAKYFSQRDAVSQMEKERDAGGDYDHTISINSGDSDSSDIDYNTLRNYEKRRFSETSKSGEHISRDTSTIVDVDNSDEEMSNLERIYFEKFKNNPDQTTEGGNERLSARSQKSSLSEGRSINLDQHSPTSLNFRSNSPNSIYSNMPSSATSQNVNKSKSPIPPLNLSRAGSSRTLNRSKSPISILSNRSSSASRKSSMAQDMGMGEESPVSSKKNDESISRTSLTRTNLNPTEFKRSDGSRELRYPNGNVKVISADGKTSKFVYYNGDIKETFYDEGRIKYFYAETNTYHTTHADGLEVLQFPDGQVEKRYADGSVEIRLPNGSVRYTDPRSTHVSEEWRFPDGAVLTVARDGEQLVRFPNGQVEVHAKDHKRREFPDGTVKLVYADGTSETRYASGRVRIKDRQGTLIMDSAAAR